MARHNILENVPEELEYLNHNCAKCKIREKTLDVKYVNYGTPNVQIKREIYELERSSFSHTYRTAPLFHHNTRGSSKG